jgi:tRNA uridine 5-carbamoylmethylation protein Kti12
MPTLIAMHGYPRSGKSTIAKECLRRAAETQQPWLYPIIEEMSLRHEPLEDDEQLWNE